MAARLTGPAGVEPARAEVHVDAGDPVFAGHYPGFPVLPGVYLIEFVDQAVRLCLDGTPVTLTAVERCRFLRPVYGGDRLDIDVTLTRLDGELRSAASMRTADGAVADIRLRHQMEVPA
jgi:3-hydroxyacyl-[acyl-carrier-protein] dehydratase